MFGSKSMEPNEMMFFPRMVIDVNGWNSWKC